MMIKKKKKTKFQTVLLCGLVLSPVETAATISQTGKCCQEEIGVERGKGANCELSQEVKVFPPLTSEEPGCSLLLLSVLGVNVPATEVYLEICPIYSPHPCN